MHLGEFKLDIQKLNFVNYREKLFAIDTQSLEGRHDMDRRQIVSR